MLFLISKVPFKLIEAFLIEKLLRISKMLDIIFGNEFLASNI